MENFTKEQVKVVRNMFPWSFYEDMLKRKMPYEEVADLIDQDFYLSLKKNQIKDKAAFDFLEYLFSHPGSISKYYEKLLDKIKLKQYTLENEEREILQKLEDIVKMENEKEDKNKEIVEIVKNHYNKLYFVLNYVIMEKKLNSYEKRSHK
ncbi:MAG: hypothetical protein QXD62_00845 [Candidatus Woesearchaeota archaeon]